MNVSTQGYLNNNNVILYLKIAYVYSIIMSIYYYISLPPYSMHHFTRIFNWFTPVNSTRNLKSFTFTTSYFFLLKALLLSRCIAQVGPPLYTLNISTLLQIPPSEHLNSLIASFQFSLNYTYTSMTQLYLWI